MLQNRNFGILNEQVITYAPLNAEIQGTWYMPASDAQLISLGYKKIVDTPYPTDGKQYTSRWEEINNQIVKRWSEIIIPVIPKTPAEMREEAYQTRLCVNYPQNSSDYITIDAAVKLVAEYGCETTARAQAIVSYLRTEITIQKENIRQEFPDVNK